MQNVKPVLMAICMFVFVTVCESVAAQKLDKDHVRQLLSSPPQIQGKLRPGTLHGCVLIPARGFIQRLMVGIESSGETCSVTVNRDNTVVIDFLGDSAIPIVTTSKRNRPTDTFVGALGNNQVLIVQHHRGEVVSVTQTVYDNNGDVVYGRSGVGEFIRECRLSMTSSEKLAGKMKCKR